MVELEKIRTLMAKHSRNLSAHYILNISSILHNTHVIFKNQKKIVFYINNYIN